MSSQWQRSWKSTYRSAILIVWSESILVYLVSFRWSLHECNPQKKNVITIFHLIIIYLLLLRYVCWQTDWKRDNDQLLESTVIPDGKIIIMIQQDCYLISLIWYYWYYFLKITFGLPVVCPILYTFSSITYFFHSTTLWLKFLGLNFTTIDGSLIKFFRFNFCQ